LRLLCAQVRGLVAGFAQTLHEINNSSLRDAQSGTLKRALASFVDDLCAALDENGEVLMPMRDPLHTPPSWGRRLWSRVAGALNDLPRLKEVKVSLERHWTNVAHALALQSAIGVADIQLTIAQNDAAARKRFMDVEAAAERRHKELVNTLAPPVDVSSALSEYHLTHFRTMPPLFGLERAFDVSASPPEQLTVRRHEPMRHHGTTPSGGVTPAASGSSTPDAGASLVTEAAAEVGCSDGELVGSTATAFEELMSGAPALRIIVGAAGMGKTTLLRRFAFW
jgi:hypothetical protein